MRKRTVLPPAGHAAIDEPRIAPGAVGGAKAQALHHARPIALDQRVGRLDQRQRLGESLRALEIEGRDPLAAPERSFQERPIGIAESRLVRADDRDNLGAEIGEHAAGERTRTNALELDHLQTCKRTQHAKLPGTPLPLRLD